MEPKGRLTWISVANVLACLAVVFLHTNVCFWSYEPDVTWQTANGIETIFYWAVPVFFMVSGATLMDYRDRYSTGTFLKKRFVRTMIPFLFWSLFSFVYSVVLRHWPCDGIRDAISGLISCRYMSIYWFFPALFAVYLSIPLLSLVPKEKRIPAFSFTAVAAFVTISVLPTLCSVAGIAYNDQLQLPVSGGYVLYLLLGYLIANHDFTRKQRGLFYALGVVGWLIHMIGTAVLSLRAGAIVGTYKGSTNFPAVMQAFGLLLFLKKVDWDRLLGRAVGVVSNMTKVTFGVYLIHYYLIDVIVSKTDLDFRSLLWRTAGALGVFAVSMGISWILSKIPVVKKTIGV